MSTTPAPKPRSKNLTFSSAGDLFDYVAEQMRPLSVGMDSIFSDFPSNYLRLGIQQTGWPRANILETTSTEDVHAGTKTYLLELALAGIPKEEIKVSVLDNILTVAYEKDDVTGTDPRGDRQYIHQEVAYRSFSRSWKLGPDVQVGEASHEDGVLTISFTRVTPKEPEPRSIEIK